MAGVNYEVNIQLNAKTLDKQLGDLEKRVNNLKKNLAAPLRQQDQASRQSVTRAQKAANLEDRIRATRVITFNLGRRLNKLEEKGIKVNEQRVQLNRAATSTNKKLVEQARTHNKLVREFVQAEERKLKLGVKTGRMQAENIDALSKAQVKRYTLDQQIRRLEEDGVNTDKLRAKLGKATNAQVHRQFGTFKQLTGELSLAIRKERDKLALQKRQTRELERQRKLGMGTGATSPIGGTPQMVGSPAYKIRQLNINANWTKFLGDLNDTAQIINATRANNARVNQFKKAQINRNWGLFLDQLNETSRVIQQSAEAGQRKTSSQRLQGVALGAGFPLLFGGGPGAILGGAAGGLVGGPAGFAAQIALSALGQQFDTFLGSTLKASQAFTSTSKAFDLVSERSLFSSQQIEARATELEKQGKVEELATLLTQELAGIIGTDGVKSLQLLGKETDEVTRLWGQLTLQLQALIAGPLANFLKLVSQFVGGITLRSQFSALEQSVTAAQAERLNEILTEKRGTRIISAQQQAAAFSDPRLQTTASPELRGKQVTIPGTITNEVLRQTLEQAAKENIKAPATPLIPVTPMDRLTIKPTRDTEAEKAAREAERELERFIEKRQRFEENQADLIQKKLEGLFKESQELEKQETILRAKLAGNEDEVLYAIELGELQEKYGVDEGRRLADKKARIRDINELLIQQQRIQSTINNLINTTGQQFTSLFETLINGTNSWNDALGNVLRTLSSTLLQTALKLLAQMGDPAGQGVGLLSILTGGFGTRANGGPVSAGSPYLVGERGPEMFVPGANGNIVPNDAMGGVQVGSINISVENTGDQLSPAAQKKIANEVQGIVMSTLVNERRSGGLLR